MARAFQVRTPERDNQTDRERLGSVSRAIESAVASVQKEKDALRPRIDEARVLASFAVGTDSDEHLTRDSKDNARLKEYERQMSVGEKRIQELERQLGGLADLHEVFVRYFPAQ